MEENNNNESKVAETVKGAAKQGAKQLVNQGLKKILPIILPYIGIFFLVLLGIGVLLVIPLLVKSMLDSLLGIFDFKTLNNANNISNTVGTSISAVYDDTLLGAAQQVHDEEMLWVYYTEHEKGNDSLKSPVSAALANEDKSTCCATYVACVLYASGYFSEEEISAAEYSFHSAIGIDRLLASSEDWELIENKEDFEAGDIVCCDKNNDKNDLDHVQIYAGDGKWFNAGNTTDIQNPAPKQGNDNWDSGYVSVWAYRAKSGPKYEPAPRVSFGGQIISIAEDGSYKLNVKDLSERILKELEEQQVNNELLGFKTEELGDMIDKYVKAEIQTTYPQTKHPNNEVDGKIIIKKASAETGKIKPLEYKSYEEFKNMLQSGNADVLTCFSINPSNTNLCVARKGAVAVYKNVYGEVVKTESFEDAYVEVTMPYQKYLQNYSTPINFLMALHVVSQDTGFMEDLLELILADRGNAEPIVLTYVESGFTNITKYDYTGNSRTDIMELTDKELIDYQKIYMTTPDTFTPEEFEEYKKQHEGITTITNSNVRDYYYEAEYGEILLTSTSGGWYVTNADTWLKSATKDIEECESKTTGGKQGPTQVLKKDNDNLKFVVEDPETGTREAWKVRRRVNVYETITTSNTSKRYTIVDNGNDINVDKFINLIQSYPNVKNNFVTAPSKIFYLLQQSEKTQKLEKIMRYVIYKLNDVDYGITDADLQYIFNDDFNLSTNGIMGGTLEEKIWFAVCAAGYSEYQAAGVLANLWAESGIRTNNMENSYEAKLGFSDETYTEAIDSGAYSIDRFSSDSVGYGLAQWTSGDRKERLYAFKLSRGVSIADEYLQIEYLLGEMSPSGGADGFAQCGMVQAFRGYTMDDWLNADSPEQAGAAFCCLFERPASSDTTQRQLKAREFYEKYKGRQAGIFVKDNSDSRVTGYYTSTRGRTFTILNQCNIEAPLDWGQRCNRAACTIIASGYTNESPTELINVMNMEYAAEGEPIIPSKYFTLYGLERSSGFMGQMDVTSYVTKLREQLRNGGYAVIWLNKGNNDSAIPYPGKEEEQWTGDIHWVAILDFAVKDGQEKMVVADWRGAKWYDIDEFQFGISNMAFISEKK